MQIYVNICKYMLAMSWVLRLKVHSNVHSQFTHDFTRFLNRYVYLLGPLRTFSGPRAVPSGSCSRLLTIKDAIYQCSFWGPGPQKVHLKGVYSNVPFEVRDVKRYIWGIRHGRTFLANFLLLCICIYTPGRARPAPTEVSKKNKRL